MYTNSPNGIELETSAKTNADPYCPSRLNLTLVLLEPSVSASTYSVCSMKFLRPSLCLPRVLMLSPNRRFTSLLLRTMSVAPSKTAFGLHLGGHQFPDDAISANGRESECCRPEEETCANNDFLPRCEDDFLRRWWRWMLFAVRGHGRLADASVGATAAAAAPDE
jgi:hypothetical protein